MCFVFARTGSPSTRPCNSSALRSSIRFTPINPRSTATRPFHPLHHPQVRFPAPRALALNYYMFYFQYLGAMFTTNGDGPSNIKQRLAMAVQALNNMQYLWKSAIKTIETKSCKHIYSQLLHGCESSYYVYPG